MSGDWYPMEGGRGEVEVGVERKLAATFYGGCGRGGKFLERGQFLGFWTRLLGWPARAGTNFPTRPFPFVH